MTTKTAGGAGRSAAARKAAEAMARRAAEFQSREKDLLALAQEFHDADERARKARAEGEARAERLLKDAEGKAAALRSAAEANAAGFEEQALAAVHKMLAFGESPASIRDLTGWPASKVRQAQRTQETTKPAAAPHAGR